MKVPSLYYLPDTKALEWLSQKQCHAVHNNEDGLLVENGNIEQLAEKICYLIENDNIRKDMGRRAKINSERFKMENISKNWETLFNQLLEHK